MIDIARMTRLVLASAKLTRQELSELCGVSRQAVYLWESGRGIPHLPAYLKLEALAKREGIMSLMAEKEEEKDGD